MPDGSFTAAMLGNNDNVTTDFYTTYCETPDRGCVISEAGAAFHVNTTMGDGEHWTTERLRANGPNQATRRAGIGELALQQAWWQDSWTNASFFAEFPKIKVVQLFEFSKVEDYEQRDYRITYNSTILSAFLSDISSSVPNLYQGASYQADATLTVAVSDTDSGVAAAADAGTTTATTSSVSSSTSAEASLFGTASGRGIGPEVVVAGLSISLFGALLM